MNILRRKVGGFLRLPDIFRNQLSFEINYSVYQHQTIRYLLLCDGLKLELMLRATIPHFALGEEWSFGFVRGGQSLHLPFSRVLSGLSAHDADKRKPL